MNRSFKSIEGRLAWKLLINNLVESVRMNVIRSNFHFTLAFNMNVDYVGRLTNLGYLSL